MLPLAGTVLYIIIRRDAWCEDDFGEERKKDLYSAMYVQYPVVTEHSEHVIALL